MKEYRNRREACSGAKPELVVRNELRRARHFAHQREQIAFAVAEETHPEIVAGHLGDHVRLVFEFSSGMLKALVSGANIADLEVKNGARMVEFRFFRLVQAQG